jgi:hypothetical protein
MAMNTERTLLLNSGVQTIIGDGASLFITFEGEARVGELLISRHDSEIPLAYLLQDKPSVELGASPDVGVNILLSPIDTLVRLGNIGILHTKERVLYGLMNKQVFGQCIAMLDKIQKTWTMEVGGRVFPLDEKTALKRIGTALRSACLFLHPPPLSVEEDHQEMMAPPVDIGPSSLLHMPPSFFSSRDANQSNTQLIVDRLAKLEEEFKCYASNKFKGRTGTSTHNRFISSKVERPSVESDSRPTEMKREPSYKSTGDGGSTNSVELSKRDLSDCKFDQAVKVIDSAPRKLSLPIRGAEDNDNVQATIQSAEADTFDFPLTLAMEKSNVLNYGRSLLSDSERSPIKEFVWDLSKILGKTPPREGEESKKLRTILEDEELKDFLQSVTLDELQERADGIKSDSNKYQTLDKVLAGTSPRRLMKAVGYSKMPQVPTLGVKKTKQKTESEYFAPAPPLDKEDINVCSTALHEKPFVPSGKVQDTPFHNYLGNNYGSTLKLDAQSPIQSRPLSPSHKKKQDSLKYLDMKMDALLKQAAQDSFFDDFSVMKTAEAATVPEDKSPSTPAIEFNSQLNKDTRRALTSSGVSIAGKLKASSAFQRPKPIKLISKAQVTMSMRKLDLITPSEVASSQVTSTKAFSGVPSPLEATQIEPPKTTLHKPASSQAIKQEPKVQPPQKALPRQTPTAQSPLQPTPPPPPHSSSLHRSTSQGHPPHPQSSASPVCRLSVHPLTLSKQIVWSGYVQRIHPMIICGQNSPQCIDMCVEWTELKCSGKDGRMKKKKRGRGMGGESEGMGSEGMVDRRELVVLSSKEIRHVKRSATTDRCTQTSSVRKKEKTIQVEIEQHMTLAQDAQNERKTAKKKKKSRPAETVNELTESANGAINAKSSDIVTAKEESPSPKVRVQETLKKKTTSEQPSSYSKEQNAAPLEQQPMLVDSSQKKSVKWAEEVTQYSSILSGSRAKTVSPPRLTDSPSAFTSVPLPAISQLDSPFFLRFKFFETHLEFLSLENLWTQVKYPSLPGIVGGRPEDFLLSLKGLGLQRHRERAECCIRVYPYEVWSQLDQYYQLN